MVFRLLVLDRRMHPTNPFVDIEGCFERPHTVDVSMTGREYGPTAGIKPLRKAVADPVGGTSDQSPGLVA